MPDTALAMYVACSLAALYGLFLFIGRWMYIGAASNVFKYVTIFMGGVFLTSTVNIHSRLQTLDGNMDYLYSWWWPWKNSLLLVSVLLIVTHMTVRLILSSPAREGKQKDKKEH